MDLVDLGKSREIFEIFIRRRNRYTFHFQLFKLHVTWTDYEWRISLITMFFFGLIDWMFKYISHTNRKWLGYFWKISKNYAKWIITHIAVLNALKINTWVEQYVIFFIYVYICSPLKSWGMLFLLLDFRQSKIELEYSISEVVKFRVNDYKLQKKRYILKMGTTHEQESRLRLKA